MTSNLKLALIILLASTTTLQLKACSNEFMNGCCEFAYVLLKDHINLPTLPISIPTKPSRTLKICQNCKASYKTGETCPLCPEASKIAIGKAKQ